MKVSLKYGLIDGGYYSGIPALFLSPGKTEKVEEELIEELMVQFEKQHMFFKLLIIDNRDMVWEQEEEVELLKVMGELKGLDIFFALYLTATHKPLYFIVESYKVVFIEDEQEPSFKVNEIRWLPDKEWNEPPLLRYANVQKYLIPGKKGLRGAYDFLMECEKAWGLILPSKQFSFILWE